MRKEQEMREEAREAIIETLRDGYDRYYCDLHHEVFNTDYYIVGTYEAKKALEEYGVFEAIEKVQTYEKDNFGELLPIWLIRKNSLTCCITLSAKKCYTKCWTPQKHWKRIGAIWRA